MSFILVCCWTSGAVSLDIVANTEGELLVIDSNTVVADSVLVKFDKVLITNGVSLVNYGDIVADIWLQNNVELFLKNVGTIDGMFHFYSGATLTQIITSNADISALNSENKYTINVTDATNINLGEILSVANNSNKIVLNNSSLVLSGTDNNFSGNIEIIGDVQITVLSDAVSSGGVVLSGIGGTGCLAINIDGVDSLYAAVGSIDGGFLYVDITRETDYLKIFNNDVGAFLQKLRANVPNDRLLQKMDVATDMSELNRVMARSVRLHPIKLLTPIRKYYQMDNLMTVYSANTAGVVGGLSYVFYDDVGVATISAQGGVKLSDNFAINVSGIVGGLSVADDINEFDGGMLGLDVGTVYDDGLIIGRTKLGIGAALFDSGAVLSANGDSVENPVGTDLHFACDFGVRLFDNLALDVIPFIGGVVNYGAVAGYDSLDFIGDAGLNLNYAVKDFDVKYLYGVRMGALTADGGYVNLHAGFVLPYDGISGNATIGLMRDDFGTGYMVSVGGKYVF